MNLDNMLPPRTAGFYPKNTMFESPFNDFDGKVMNVVMPNVTTFSYTYIYPNKSKVRSGPDFSAVHYLSDALNFNLRQIFKLFNGSLITYVVCRVMEIIDGPLSWGSLVNKTTNSFNGMIGMVQRVVIYRHFEFKSILFLIFLVKSGGRVGNGSHNFNTPPQ